MVIQECINGVPVELETENYYFSRSGVDRGTLFMLQTVFGATDGTADAKAVSTEKVLDLGCGYGVVGIYVKKAFPDAWVVMLDVEEDAVKLSEQNLQRNGLEGVSVIRNDGLKAYPEREFSLILSNPPFHTDFSVAKEFIEDGFKALKTGGSMVMVTKRRTWYENKLKTVFGGVRVTEKDGYFVFVSEKRPRKPVRQMPAPAMSKKLARKMRRGKG